MMNIDQELELDRSLYGISFERLINGQRERLDPTTIKMTVVKPNNISFYPEHVSENPGMIKIETK